MFQTCPRQALQAYSLGFEHPISKEWIYFERNFPSDMEDLLTKLRNVTNG
jgi:23S rRNA pseudouridine1911/1915/1917 synthase